MVYPKPSGEEITRRGKKHYENLRTQIETAVLITGIVFSSNAYIGQCQNSALQNSDVCQRA